MITSLMDLSSDARHRLHFLSILTMALLLLASMPRQSHAQSPLDIERGGRIGGRVLAADAQGAFAYVGQGATLVVLDVSGPTFEKVAEVDFNALIAQVLVSGDRVYVIPGNRLIILDISDPTNPTILSDTLIGEAVEFSRQAFEFAMDMELAGDILYVVRRKSDPADPQGSLRLIDVSDPANPAERAQVPFEEPEAVSIDGDVAYVVAGLTQPTDERRLIGLDVSDPANPTEVLNQARPTTFGVFAQDALLYLGSRDGLTILDVSDPANPTEVGTALPGRFLVDLQVVDDIVYGADFSDLVTIDVSNPATPVSLGRTPVGGFIRDLQVGQSGPGGKTMVFTADDFFRMFDVSDPANPTPDQAIVAPAFTTSMVILEDHLYVIEPLTVWHYRIEDGTDMVDPVLLNQFPLPVDASLAVTDGTLLYLAAFGVASGINIYDLSDPNALVPRGAYVPNAEGDFHKLEVRDGLLYLTYSTFEATTSTLEIIDVSNPDAPTRIGALALGGGQSLDLFVPGSGVGKTANDDVLYVSTGDLNTNTGQLHAVDIADPTDPTLLSTTDMPGIAQAVWADGETVFVASLIAPDVVGWFLEAYDVSDPASPVQVAQTTGDELRLWDLVQMPDGTLLASFPEEGLLRAYQFDPGTTAGKRGQAGFSLAGIASDVGAILNLFPDFDPEHSTVFAPTGLWDVGNPSITGTWGFYSIWVSQSPTLIMGLASDAYLDCPVEDDVVGHFVASVNLTANPVDDWNVQSIRFTALGNVTTDELKKEDIFLIIPGGSVNPAILNTDADGRITSMLFPLGFIIPAGETRTLSLFYAFKTFKTKNENVFAPCPLLDDDRDGLEFPVSTSVAQLNAGAVNLPPGTKLPPGTTFTSIKHTIACVHNLTLQTGFDDIVSAEAEAETGNEIAVCPGVYEENVVIDVPGLTVRSYEGPSVTTIKAADPAQDVITIDKTNRVMVRGFMITGGDDGVEISNALQCEIGGSGASAGKAGVQEENLERNVISGNQARGVHIVSGTANRILGNYIGLNVAGTAALGNRQSGIFVSNGSSDTIIGGTIDQNGNVVVKGNVISGNGSEEHKNSDSQGIKSEGVNTQILGNIIGLRADETAPLGNVSDGIKSSGNKAVIGGAYNQDGTLTIAGNVASGNGDVGINVVDGDNVLIYNNIIGLDKALQQRFENGVGGLEVKFATRVFVGGTEENMPNTIALHSKHGIQAFGSESNPLDSICIVGNRIGFDPSGSPTLLSNIDGITISDGSNIIIEQNVINNQRSGGEIPISFAISVKDVDELSITENKIFDNDNGIKLKRSTNITVELNRIQDHTDQSILDAVGLIADGVSSTSIKRNTFRRNELAVEISNSQVTVRNNTFRNNGTCAIISSNTTGAGISAFSGFFSNTLEDCANASTGLHLTDVTNFEVRGNQFTNNAGAAVMVEGNSRGIQVNQNNFAGNPDFGLLNATTTSVDAQGNFWGTADGPSGEGTGSGDAVSAGVDFSGFLAEPLTVVAATPADTLFIEAGQANSLSVLVQNFAALDGTLAITATDEQGWLTTPTTVTVTLEDSIGAEAFIHLAVPVGTARGTANTVQIEVVNPADANQRDAVTVLVLVGDATLVGIEEIEDVTAALPRTFALHQNYPNPFNPNTVILYEVPVASRVRLEVYNVLGQRVAQLLDRSQTPGRHRVVWDAAGSPSGLYFVRFQTEALAGSHRFEAVKKMILLR